MTAARADCAGCDVAYVVRADGTLRAHKVSGRRCSGSLKPPRAAPVAVARSLRPEVLACQHDWSGWTRLPSSATDFRQCAVCRHVEMQERKPCALCADADARAYEVPDYGTAYVCTPCLEATT